MTPPAIVVESGREDAPLIMNMIVLAGAMGLGSILSGWFKDLGLTLPAYIGAMMVASMLRNLDDATGWLRIDTAALDFVGGFALNIFIVVALMDLKLWQLAGQALPLFVILVAAGGGRGGVRSDDLVPADGTGLRLGGDVQRIRRLRARDHGQRGGQHAGAGHQVRAGAAGVPGGAAGGRFFIDFVNAIVITFFVNWMR